MILLAVVIVLLATAVLFFGLAVIAMPVTREPERVTMLAVVGLLAAALCCACLLLGKMMGILLP